MNEFMRRMLYLPQQASTMASEVDHLHYFVIISTMIGSAGVLGAALWFFARYRREPHERPLTPYVHVEFRREVALWFGLLLLFSSYWIVGFHQYARLETPPPDAMPIYVMGKQWMWKFAYPDGPGSVGVLYVPAGRPVKLILTSRDVIHSFFVPAFRIKQDAIPGRYTTAWFEATTPGTYHVFCAEYCGLQHSRMEAEVVVLEPEAFERWRTGPTVASGIAPPRPQASPPDETETWPDDWKLGVVAKGLEIAGARGCLRCHSVDGSPHVGPTWVGLYGSERTFVDGTRTVADEAYLTASMMDPNEKVVTGFAPIMPSYQGQLPAPDTAAIVEYIRSLKDRGVPRAPGLLGTPRPEPETRPEAR